MIDDLIKMLCNGKLIYKDSKNATVIDTCVNLAGKHVQCEHVNTQISYYRTKHIYSNVLMI